MEATRVFCVFNTFTEVFHGYHEGLSSGIGEQNSYLDFIILTSLSKMQYKATNFFLLELYAKHLWNWNNFQVFLLLRICFIKNMGLENWTL